MKDVSELSVILYFEAHDILTYDLRVRRRIGCWWNNLTIEARPTERRVGKLQVIGRTIKWTSTGLIIANGSNYVEILTRVDLVIRLHLLLLVDDTLADISERLTWYRVGNGAITWGLLKADTVIKST